MKNKSDIDLFPCSFCGKDRYQVEHIIVGPQVNICNECVAIAHKINIEVAAKKQEKRILENMRRLCFYEFWGTD